MTVIDMVTVLMAVDMTETELGGPVNGATPEDMENAARRAVMNGYGLVVGTHEWQRFIDDGPTPSTSPLLATMRATGVKLSVLLAEFGSGKALAHTLNGLSLLDLGYAQPLMDDDDPNHVYDGYWQWKDVKMGGKKAGPSIGIMFYRGTRGPSGDGGPAQRVVQPDDLVMMF